MLSGSAPLSAELIEQFAEATGDPGPPGLRPHRGRADRHQHPVQPESCSSGSVGAALPGIEIKLLDELGHEPEGDDPGEIWIRGANMFSGYWPDGEGGPDGDGWWGTGDVGFLDASGDLFLVDRLKELVIVSGFNVYPVEVEEVIREVPGVAEAAVIGVDDPAHRRGGRRLRQRLRRRGAEAVAAAVREHCAVRLARFKQPSRIEVVDELPLTVTGKVQKGRLRGIERRRSLGLLE